MFTYVVYNLVLIGATISAYIYEKSDNKNIKTIFYFFTFLIPFIFLSIRYNIGTDYKSYVDYFYRIASGEFVPKEPGYIILNFLIAKLGLNVQWLFVIFGFFFLFFSYKSLPRDGFALGVFLFISTMYLYEGFSAIRQGLAISIMAYAMRYIYNKEFKKYFLWSIVAMMFHLVTGLVLLLIYPIVKKNYNKFVLLIIILIAFFLIIFVNIQHYLFSIVFSLLPKYAWYLNSDFLKPSSIGSGLGMLFKVSLVIVILFFKDKIVIRYPMANIPINLSIFYIIFLLLRTKAMIFLRAEHIFIFYMIISIVYFLNTIKGWDKVLSIVLILSVYSMFYIKYIENGTGGENSAYVNPYQTIFGGKK